MTITAKQIRAALYAATPGAMTSARLQEIADIPGGSWRMSSWHRRELLTEVYRLREAEKMLKAWLAWCLEQIEARDALLRRFVDHYAGGHDDYCSGCHRNCAEARKVMEESK